MEIGLYFIANETAKPHHRGDLHWDTGFSHWYAWLHGGCGDHLVF